MSQIRHVDRATLAGLLGIGQRTITGFVASYPDFPTRLRSGRREFPLARCVKWYVEYKLAVVEAQQRRRKGRASGPETPAYRKALANAELAELEVARELRSLVPAEDADAALQDICDRMHLVVRGLRSRHAEEFLGIGTKVEALRRLARVEEVLLTGLRECVAEWAEPPVSELAA